MNDIDKLYNDGWWLSYTPGRRREWAVVKSPETFYTNGGVLNDRSKFFEGAYDDYDGEPILADATKFFVARYRAEEQRRNIDN